MDVFENSEVNMKILIKSKSEIEKIFCDNSIITKTAVISIKDHDGEFAELKYPPDFLLQISFDDVDNDVIIDEAGWKATNEQIKLIEEKYHMFTDAQADLIADFYFTNVDKAEAFICQCEYGQSRSAAVAAAILEFKSRKGIDIFSNDRYYPNKVVFRKTLKSLKKYSLKSN